MHYRFHPLGGQRVTRLQRKSWRGNPQLVVTDAQGVRYYIPEWMTAPEAAQWAVREVPRLSVKALADLHELVSAFLREPSSARQGDARESSQQQVRVAVRRTQCAALRLWPRKRLCAVRPPSQLPVDLSQRGPQRRLVEGTVIVHSTANRRILRLRELVQALVRAPLQRPAQPRTAPFGGSPWPPCC